MIKKSKNDDKVSGKQRVGPRLPDARAVRRSIVNKSRENIVGVMADNRYIVVSPRDTTSTSLDQDRMAVLECDYQRVLGFAVTSKETELPLILVTGWHQSRQVVHLAHQEDFAALCFAWASNSPAMGSMLVGNLPDHAQAAVRRAHEKNVVFNWLNEVKGEALVPADLVKKVKPLLVPFARECAASLKEATNIAKAALDELDAPIQQIAALLLLSDSRVLLDVPAEVVRTQTKDRMSVFRWLCSVLHQEESAR